MDDDVIVAAYVSIDTLRQELGHRAHPLARVSDAEVLTVAVVAAAYFQHHQARALEVLGRLGYLSGPLSPSRFNRRLHHLADWLPFLLATLATLFTAGEAFVVDSMPVPVCKRARAWRCRTVRGIEYCGSCAAKKEQCFGWRRHLGCPPGGVPVAFDLVPGRHHDLTPIHELTDGLAAGAGVYGDKGDNAAADEATILADTGGRLIPIRKANMTPTRWADKLALRAYRKRIESANSQLAAMGVQRLHVRTTAGLERKLHASLFAVACINLAHDEMEAA